MSKLNKLKSCRKQAGIVMLVTLIALVIMLLASIALIRSTDTNLLVSGHLSFKRDIVNQAERTMPVIKQLFSTTTSPVGALSSAVSREQNKLASNYFATIQPSNAFGIPNALMSNLPNNTIGTATPISDSTSGTTIYYMIDRMCLVAGPATATACSTSKPAPLCNPSKNPSCVAPTESPIYRISIRATGPRNTEAYIQSTFTAQ